MARILILACLDNFKPIPNAIDGCYPVELQVNCEDLFTKIFDVAINCSIGNDTSIRVDSIHELVAIEYDTRVAMKVSK
jgi:hypothetical protein